MKAGVSPAGLISRQDALLCALKLKPPGEKPTGLSKSIKGVIRLGFHPKGVGGFSQWRLNWSSGGITVYQSRISPVTMHLANLKVCLLQTKKKTRQGRNESRPVYKMTPNSNCEKSASFSWPEKPSTSLHALIGSCVCVGFITSARAQVRGDGSPFGLVSTSDERRSQKEHHLPRCLDCGKLYGVMENLNSCFCESVQFSWLSKLQCGCFKLNEITCNK